MDVSHFTRPSGFAAAVRSADLLRLGLVSGAVLTAGFAFGALVYVLEPDATERKAVEQVAARIPRPRPSEPVTTGSISRARPIPLDLESALALTAPTPAHTRAQEELRSKAVLTASASAECDEVASSEVLENRGNPEDPAVVWVQCKNGTRFYLDRHRLEADAVSQPERAAPLALSDAQAVRACEDKVRLGLPMPASLARHGSSTGVDRAPGDDPVVTFDADALNGLGFPLDLRVQCVFDEHRIARLQVDPR